MEEKYSMPSKSLLILMDLKKQGRITEEELKIIVNDLTCYMDIRCEHFKRK